MQTRSTSLNYVSNYIAIMTQLKQIIHKLETLRRLIMNNDFDNEVYVYINVRLIFVENLMVYTYYVNFCKGQNIHVL